MVPVISLQENITVLAEWTPQEPPLADRPDHFLLKCDEGWLQEKEQQIVRDGPTPKPTLFSGVRVKAISSKRTGITIFASSLSNSNSHCNSFIFTA
jgi:hypothetical protein